MQTDAAIPAGNTVVLRYDEANRTAYLEKELRDTKGNWFYWKFRTVFSGEEAENTYTFRFENGPAMGECGPAVSCDCGKTWQWLGADSILRDPVDAFTFTCKQNMTEVWFCMGIPYLQGELDSFLQHRPDIRKSTLCKTRKNRDTELLTMPGGKKKIFLTCRHHACEMMASYVLEGILAAIDTEIYTVYAVPFIDKDGVEDGDQGKYRSPHDHNRDYGNDPIYPETEAVMRLIREIKPDIALDLHCPWLHDVGNPNGTSRMIHYLESANAVQAQTQHRFGKLLEDAARPLKFRDADMLPYGSEWNSIEENDPLLMFDTWAQQALPGAELVLTMEIPYAKVYDTPILAEDARRLGNAFSKVLNERKYTR